MGVKSIFQPFGWRPAAALALLWILGSPAVAAAEEEAGISLVDLVFAEQEPLHVVRYESDQFIIYTNLVESGVQTEYHKHNTDLLAVIPAAASVTSQKPGEVPKAQWVKPGTVAFFPYGSQAEPYVHRVGAKDGTTFVNVGLDFRLPLSASCNGSERLWTELGVEPLDFNRRGQPYRLSLLPGQRVALPEDGRALLLVPLGDAELETDNGRWSNKLGGFRFYEDMRPATLANPADEAVTLVVFKAC